jgi:hypothetical protein
MVAILKRNYSTEEGTWMTNVRAFNDRTQAHRIAENLNDLLSQCESDVVAELLVEYDPGLHNVPLPCVSYEVEEMEVE